MKTLICEAGATKADWRVLENGIQTAAALTSGTNFSSMSLEAVKSVMAEAASALPEGPYGDIHYYAAGLTAKEAEEGLRRHLGSLFQCDDVEIQTDLVASVRAACGHNPGIAAIIGTGSNSCLWDGKEIVRNVRSGGFILGDEGSASALGRLFISDYIKGLVPVEIAEEYARNYPSEYSEIVDLVYHNPGSPSGWLGSLCPFIASHYGHPYIKGLVDGNFRSFLERSLGRYDTGRYEVGIVGGFAFAMQDIIRPIFEEGGIRIRVFIKSPVEELLKFHSA